MMKLNATKLLKQLHAIEAGLEGVVDLSMMKIAQMGAEVAKANTKGKLAEATMAINPGKHVYQIVSNKFYASWYEFGNGPLGGRIYPVHAKALRFTINGATVFAKSVRTSAPHPYMSKAKHLVEFLGPGILADDIDNFLKRTK
jgi:hypothetical protein